MLVRLLIKNYLLVRTAELAFAPGLNVLTGETGTGKSLLLGALGLALGRRAATHAVGPHGPRLQVEATFRADANVRRTAAAMGIALEGNELILVREVRAGGGGRCFVNGQRVLQRLLQRLGNQLVEIHGQRQEERFRSADVQRDLLDLFGGQGDLRRRVRAGFRIAQQLEQALGDHGRHLDRLREEEDWIRFQLQEIDELNPAPQELVELRERAGRRRESESRREWLALAEQCLNGPEGAVLEALETLDARASGLPQDADGQDLRERLRLLRHEVRELYQRVTAMRAAAEDEGERGQILDERRAALEHLERKHRKPLAEILEVAARMREKLRALAAGGDREQVLRQELQEAHQALGVAARELSAARRKSAAALERSLGRELGALSMSGCRLQVAFEEPRGAGVLQVAFDEPRGAGVLQVAFDEPPGAGVPQVAFDEPPGADGPQVAFDEPPGADGPQVAFDEPPGAGVPQLPAGHAVGAAGGERVRFNVETNPGAGFRPLGEVASGGEMARIALALRVILGRRGRPLLTVFDEIDAGLGATAARAVADRLVRVAAHRQVLLVTHLPVIAARAARHLHVIKSNDAGAVSTTARRLTQPERVIEIARMLSGDAQDRRARRHAAALLAGDDREG